MATVPPVSSNHGVSRARMEGRIIQGRYELGKKLGAGNFAKVHLARDLRSNSQVAIKIMDKEMIYKNKLAAHILREIAIMKRVKHPYIVKIFEVMATKSDVYLVMEYVRGGELFQRVSKGRLREDTARHYFQQLITAVDFCHSHEVFHRDLKPENILVDDNGDLKVTDFGLSALNEGQRNAELGNVLQTFVGTPAYIAPEVLKRQGYDGSKVDIWSCGIILFVLMAGYLPFNDKNISGLYRKIYRGEFRCPIWFPPDLIRLIRGILTTDPSKRMSIKEIKENSWFKKGYSPPRMEDEELLSDDEDGSYNQEHDVDDEVSESGYDSDTSIVSCPAKLAGKQLLRLPTLNSFDIISFSSSLDLSGLFGDAENETRFLAKKPAEEIISKLEEIGKIVSYKVKKNNTKLILDGRKDGMIRSLVISAEIFQIAPGLAVLHVRKKAGNKAPYEEFLNKELKPRLGNLMESPQVRTPQRMSRSPSPLPAKAVATSSSSQSQKPLNSLHHESVPNNSSRQQNLPPLIPKSPARKQKTSHNRSPTFGL